MDGPTWAGPNYPKQVYELAAAQQNNGCVQFFGLDLKLQLWTTAQSAPGGDWTPWSGPNWNNAQKEWCALPRPNKAVVAVLNSLGHH